MYCGLSCRAQFAMTIEFLVNLYAKRTDFYRYFRNLPKMSWIYICIIVEAWTNIKYMVVIGKRFVIDGRWGLTAYVVKRWECSSQEAIDNDVNRCRPAIIKIVMKSVMLKPENIGFLVVLYHLRDDRARANQCPDLSRVNAFVRRDFAEFFGKG